MVRAETAGRRRLACVLAIHNPTVGALRRYCGSVREDSAALRDDAVRRLLGADLASLSGDFMVLAAMPFAVLAMGGGGQQIALALAMQGVGVLLGLPVGGVLGDRLPRRSVMVAADLMRLGSQAVLAALLISGEALFWQLLAAQLIHGGATGLYSPAAKAIVPDAVAESAVQPTNGLKAVARAVAGAGGPAPGAIAVTAFGPGLVMALDAATFAISAALLGGLPVAGRFTRPRGKPGVLAALRGSGAELREGWRQFRSLPWMVAIVAQFTFLNALVIAPLFVFGPTLSAESLGGAGAWAWLLSALALGEFLGGAAAISLRPRRPLVTATIAFAAWVPALVLLAALAPLATIVAAAALAGVGSALCEVIWETTVQTHAPQEQLSRLISIDHLGSLAFVPLGFAIGGLLEATVGAPAALLGGALLLLASAALVLASPSVRSLGAAAPGSRRRAEASAERGLAPASAPAPGGTPA